MLTLPPMGAIKGTSRRVWMSDPDLQKLKKISEAIRLGQTELLSQIIHAGLEAIGTDEHIRLELPLRFTPIRHVDSARWQETEPPTAKRR
jgi:2,4-dienoyl-CoA reductase-like NADH-dependent reductase (Old Yellow Enzyme family)